jgi:hypothetical protein
LSRPQPRPKLAGCSVCAHVDIAEINQLLLEKRPLRQIERRFGCCRAALSRHSRSHIPENLKKEATAEIAAVGAGDDRPVVDQVKSVCADMRRLIKRAEQSGHLQIASQTMKNLATTLETLAKLTGELEQPPTAVFNFQMCDQFVRAAELRRKEIDA